MTYAGLRHGPPEVLARLARGEAVYPGVHHFRVSRAHFRVSCAVTNSDPRHGRLNRVPAMVTDHRLPPGPVHSVSELA